MNACRVTSTSATNARLVAKRDHADHHKNTKPDQRRRKAARRDFRIEIALCLYGLAAMSHSVEL